MSLSMYEASVPAFVRALNNLNAILEKARDYEAARKLGADVLPCARLFPDMFALARQVQLTSDYAKGCASRLAGIEIPVYEDTEKTLEELQARLAKTIAFLLSIKPEAINGSEEKDIHLKAGGQEMQFKGQQFLVGFGLPNVYFHMATAYNILRHNGVEIGKRDFLGAL